MKLGLDLRGGVHFLMEVDLKAAVSQRLESYASEIKQMLRKERIRFRSVDVGADGEIEIRFLNQAVRSRVSTGFDLNIKGYLRIARLTMIAQPPRNCCLRMVKRPI